MVPHQASTSREPASGESKQPEFRNTKQRRTVVDVLRTLEEFHSAQELHRIIADRGGKVSLATVYRVLQSMAEGGDVDTVQDHEGQALYRTCQAEEHHHHLLCRHCGRAENIEADVVEKWASAIGASFGYSDIEHTIELTGICADCSRNNG